MLRKLLDSSFLLRWGLIASDKFLSAKQDNFMYACLPCTYVYTCPLYGSKVSCLLTQLRIYEILRFSPWLPRNFTVVLCVCVCARVLPCYTFRRYLEELPRVYKEGAYRRRRNSIQPVWKHVNTYLLHGAESFLRS